MINHFHDAGRRPHGFGFVAAMIALAGWCGTAQAQPQDDTVLSLEQIKTGSAAVEQVFTTKALQPALKGVTRLAIPIFTVETVQKTGKGVRRSSPDGGSVAQNVTYLLEGVPQQAMQQAVDKMYDEFVADLKNLGIEVVSPAEMMATKAYAGASSGAAPTAGPKKVESGDMVVEIYSAKGMQTGGESRAIYFNDLAGGGGGGLLGAVKVLSNVAGQVSGAGAAAAISAELGVPSIAVQIPLEFVEQTSSSSGGFFSSKTSVAVASDLRLSFATSGYIGVSAAGGSSSSLPIRQRIVLGGTPIKEIKDTSSVAANVGMALFSAVIGSKSSTRLTEKTAVADGDKFVASVSEGLSKLREAMKAGVEAMR